MERYMTRHRCNDCKFYRGEYFPCYVEFNHYNNRVTVEVRPRTGNEEGLCRHWEPSLWFSFSQYFRKVAHGKDKP